MENTENMVDALFQKSSWKQSTNWKKPTRKPAKTHHFQKELDYYLSEFVGRPTPLYYAENLTRKVGGAKIYLKREDLAHGGAHKINNTIGQALAGEADGKNPCYR